MPHRPTSLRGLYAITDASLVPDACFAQRVEAALRGGARIIQYRDKSAWADRRLSQARVLSELCDAHGAKLIINDDVGLAAAVGAGVHLGEEDASPHAARKRLGPQALIGLSCYNNLNRALEGEREGVDYVAFGRFYPSSTKPEAVRASPDLLVQARQHLTIPVAAIGGIQQDNGAVLVRAGADMLAVVRGVFGAGDIQAAARALSGLFR